MSLTRDEVRRLDEISADVHRSDQRLARALSSGRFPSGRSLVLRGLVLVAVLATLVVGVALQVPVLCAVAWTGVMLVMVCFGIAGD